jgi:hypothetical protein
MTTVNKSTRNKAIALLILILFDTLTPVASYALTGGPSQPEVQSFEPAGTSQMVDLSSGSFVYNVPLLEVNGYPLNLSYHSGINMDQEASCVGLGWGINPGAINRNMRGLPDDFKGNGTNADFITKQMTTAPNQTYGGSVAFRPELFGLSKFLAKAGIGLTATLGASYNNYKGVGFDFGVTPTLQAGKIGGNQFTAGLGLSASTFGGVSIQPDLSFTGTGTKRTNDGEETNTSKLGIGVSMNSRQGLKSINVDVDNKHKTKNMITRGETNSSSAYSSTFSFASPSYTPQLQAPYSNFSFSANIKGGFALMGFHPNLNITGYYSQQSIAISSVAGQKTGAYGSLYAHERSKTRGGLMDFNRELDGAFTRNRPNLAIPIPTQDVYGVSGQGIGGSYQLKRGDIGVVYDQRVDNPATGVSVGGELGGGGLFHGGANIGVNNTTSYSGRWTNDNIINNNVIYDKLNYSDTLTNNNDYETAYFKNAGERTVESDTNFINNIGGTKPVRVGLKSYGTSLLVSSENKLIAPGGEVINVTAPLRRAQRDKRNQSISWMTSDEASRFGLETTIKNYTLNTFTGNNYAVIQRSGGYRKPHHLSEVTTLREDGVRYVYGISAYNIEQNEVSFGVNGASANCATGLVSYTPGVDNSINNPKIPEKYFNKVTTPAYAHSFLLTSIVSPDYVDATGNGCTSDDYGNYTKFNYNKSNEYQWRVPIEANTANFSQGYKSDATDDKANYIHGKKEIWNVHSVDSKNQVAYFYYSNRSDGKGVISENGGRSTADINQKLDSIVLYNKTGINGQISEPIKKVFFEYTYDLCKGLPNTSGVTPQDGKLTLRKLYFTYGNSNKGKLSPYKFYYGGDNSVGLNPSYNLKGYDRWGNYKPNPTATTCGNNDPVTNVDFPYVVQDKLLTDQYTAAWTMNKIQLPSGGIINIDYESNDYSYVQDKRATQMMPIYGLSDNTTAPIPANADASLLYNGTPLVGSNRFMFFKMNRVLSGTATALQDSVKNMFFNGRPDSFYVYFKCFTALDGQNKYESVAAYAKIVANSWGVAKSNTASTTFDLAYVKLQPAEPDDNNSITSANAISPITKAALQFTRIHLPKIAFGEPEVTSSNKEQVLSALASLSTQMKQYFTSFNSQLIGKLYCNKINLSKSWLRLTMQDHSKLGGGCRVKKITISDEWQTMAGTPNTTYAYGQEYFYSKEETLPTGERKTISSGVASYEPMVGGDENPFKQPIFVTEKLILAPDQSYFIEGPKMESLFPGPSVLYSKVMVRNLQRTNVKKHATGYSVSEYYTAKDFPTLVKDTGVDPQRKNSSAITSFLKIGSKDFMTASQGYAIELNDMHGKPKAQWSFDELNNKLSGVEYIYKTDPLNGAHLDNSASVVMADGTVKNNSQIGMDYTMIADSREAVTTTNSFNISGNLESFWAILAPLAVPIILPGLMGEKTQFRSMVTTKVIQRYGLLDKVRAYEHGAIIETQNLAYDAETGNVLLTKSQNEFNDAHYDFQFPAHWAYEGMQSAYKNIGATFKGAFAYNTTTGYLTLPNTTNMTYLAFGDELSCQTGSTFTKAWVIDVDKTNFLIKLVDVNGQLLTGTTYSVIKNLRSGRKNLQATPVAAVKTKTPIITGSNTLTFQNVLEASATEFSDNWQTAGEVAYYDGFYQTPTSTNAYRVGSKGNWRPMRSWSYLVDRNATVNAGQTSDLRNDGQFKFFNQFWKTPMGANPLWTIDSTNWTWSKKNTKIDGHGNQLESIDPLNRYESKLMGYNNTLVSAIAQNAKYNEISADSYEDVYGQAYADTVASYQTLADGEFADPFPRTFLWEYKGVSMQKVVNSVQEAVDYMNELDPGGNWYHAEGVRRIRGGRGASIKKYVIDNNINLPSGFETGTAVNLLGDYGRLKLFTSIYNLGFRSIQFANVTKSSQQDKPNAIGPLVSNSLGGATSGMILNTTKSHCGTYSIKLESPVAEVEGKMFHNPQSTSNRGGFSLKQGKYVLSAWVSVDNMPANTVTYADSAAIAVNINGVRQYMRPSGNILDGWQRIYGEFDIPAVLTSITLVYQGRNTYFDDLRVHPFNAIMKSFVYDPLTLRYVAELDENNYPTYYEYDKAGNLDHVKKVTDKGVQTIKEVRAGAYKGN